MEKIVHNAISQYHIVTQRRIGAARVPIARAIYPTKLQCATQENVGVHSHSLVKMRDLQRRKIANTGNRPIALQAQPRSSPRRPLA